MAVSRSRRPSQVPTPDQVRDEMIEMIKAQCQDRLRYYRQMGYDEQRLRTELGLSKMFDIPAMEGLGILDLGQWVTVAVRLGLYVDLRVTHPTNTNRLNT